MWYLLAIIVVVTSAWVGVDASLNKIPSDVTKPYSSNNGAISWVFLCLMLWVVGFPAYLIIRSKVFATRANEHLPPVSETAVKLKSNIKEDDSNARIIDSVVGIETKKVKAEIMQCPFCAEDIKSAAKVCKHCKKDLVLSFQSKPVNANESSVIATALFYAMALAIFGYLIGQYTGFGGGLASIAEPFSKVRNEIANGYAAMGGIVGFLIGAVSASQAKS